MGYLLVFLGGGFGAMLRHGINVATPRLLGGGFPWSTLLINISGSLVMGLVAGWFAFKGDAPQAWRLFLTTGILDRFPRLKFVSVESGMGYLPYLLESLDWHWKAHGAFRYSPLLPSEYFRDHVSVTFQDDWVAFQTTHLVNHERLLWASDHPHSDSTFPESQRVLAKQTAHLDPDVRDDIVWRNTARLYRLDQVPSS